MEQAPPEHDGVPLVALHAFPHVPQCERLVAVLTSQPLVLMPSQLPQPVLHPTSVQVPSPQDSVALARSQTAPHVPQLVVV